MSRIESLIELMSSAPTLFIVVLGVFSLTRLVVSDTFPLFAAPREWIFDRFPPSGHTTRKRPIEKRAKFIVTGDHYYVNEGHWLGDLLSCNWCAGWWVSLAVTTALLFVPTITLGILIPFALRACVGLIGIWDH